MLPFLHVMLPVLALTGSFDRVAVVRVSPDSGKLHLFMHHALSAEQLALSPVVASDLSFGTTKGKHPVRAVFAADLDGDGKDEIAVLREQLDKGGAYQILAYSAPDELFGDVGAPIAQSAYYDLGAAGTFGKIVSIDGVDVDDDAMDEIAIVREFTNGTQRLEVRDLKLKHGKLKSTLVRACPNFGVAPFDEVKTIAAVDVDGDGMSDITALRGSPEQPILEAARAPMTPSDSQVLVIDTEPIDFTAASATAIDIDHDGLEEQIVLHNVFGQQFLAIGAAPPVGIFFPVVFDTGPTFEGGPTMGGAGGTSIPLPPGDPAVAVINVRGTTSVGNGGVKIDTDDLDGKVRVNFHHQVFFGYSGGDDVDVDEDGNSDGHDNGGVTISMSDGQVLEGALDLEKQTVSLGVLPVNVFDQESGSSFQLNLNPGFVVVTKDAVEVHGTYSGSGTTMFGMPIFVQLGQWTLTRKN